MLCLMAHKSRYGAGSIRKRDEGRWELRVSVGRDPVTGQHRYLSRSVRGTKRAEAVMAALLVEVSHARPTCRSHISRETATLHVPETVCPAP